MKKRKNSRSKRPKSITDVEGYSLYFKKICERSKEKYESGNQKSQEKVILRKAYYGAEPIFYRSVYRFTQKFLCQKYSGESLEAVARNAGLTFDPRSVDNPFNLALALFATPAGIPMSRSKRARLSKAMSYAFEHDIEPRWLLGFLHQAGGYVLASKKYERMMSKAATCTKFENLKKYQEPWFVKSAKIVSVRKEFSLLYKVFRSAKAERSRKFKRV